MTDQSETLKVSFNGASADLKTEQLLGTIPQTNIEGSRGRGVGSKSSIGNLPVFEM